MKGEAIQRKTQSATSATGLSSSCDKSKTTHAVKFVPLRDSRNRKVPGLSQRGSRIYGQLWVEDEGRKVPRRFALLTPEGDPVSTLTEAKEAFDLLRHHRREETLPILGHKPSLAAWVEIYLSSGPFLRKKVGTQQNERQALERWVHHCGEVQVDKIATSHVAAFIDLRLRGKLDLGRHHQRLRPASERTVQLDVVSLRNALRAARDAGKLRELPRMPALKPPPPRKKATVEPSDLDKLFQAVPLACRKNAVTVEDYLRLLAYCGAREQETLRIKWSDVDFANAELTVGEDGDAKNLDYRIIEFNPALRNHLEAMHTRRQPDSVWLFPSPQRGAVDRPSKTFRESLNLVRTAAGLPHFGFHDFRRYFCTLCIQCGVDVQTTARWVGHKDGGVLVAKTYANVLGSHRTRMAEKLILEGAVQ